MLEKLRKFKDDFMEIMLVIKVCLTTIWFWVPVLFASYFYLQLWMIFFIHPLTILIGPAALSIISLIYEEKRIRIQYGLEEIKILSASDPIGASPRWKRIRWDIEKAVMEYKKALKKKKKQS